MSLPIESSAEAPQQNDLLTISEAVTCSRVSASTLWRYIKQGRLQKVQIGGHGCRVFLRRYDLSAITGAEVGVGAVIASGNLSGSPASRKLSGRMPAWKSFQLNVQK